MQNRFEERYKSGDTPWDHNAPDGNLIDVITHKPICGCKALEIGCGTGNNAIWLAQNNFDVTGCDIAETAIAAAKKKAAASTVDCTFCVADFLINPIPGQPFGFVFDRGCFHSLDTHRERAQFAVNVFSHLNAGGRWLTLVGNADDRQNRDVGPPRLTAEDLVSAVEPCFEIISLTTGHFGSNQVDPPSAWICLMQKRDTLRLPA